MPNSSPSPDRKKPSEDWESFAERRIREAQQAGEFDKLPGFGQPIPGIDLPLDENWWVKDKLRREQVNALPPILQARLDIEKTLAALASLDSEFEVRRRLESLNEKILAAHYSHVSGPAAGVTPVDVEATIAEWRQSRV